MTVDVVKRTLRKAIQYQGRRNQLFSILIKVVSTQVMNMKYYLKNMGLLILLVGKAVLIIMPVLNRGMVT